MPRCYCDYCDTYLTHDSPSVRKQHNVGYKHEVGAQFNQHLLSLPEAIPKPCLPMMPMSFILGMRPPILSTPTAGAVGYHGGYPPMPPGVVPPSLPRPPIPIPVIYQPAPQPGSAAPPGPQGGPPPSTL